MTDVEDLVLREARRQNLTPNADAIMRAAIELAGSQLSSDGMIVMPGARSIAPADFVRSLHKAMPEAFQAITEKPAGSSSERRPDETLTDFMRRQRDADRKRPLPDWWDEVRSKVTGLTAQMMDLRAAAIRGNDHDL